MIVRKYSTCVNTPYTIIHILIISHVRQNSTKFGMNYIQSRFLYEFKTITGFVKNGNNQASKSPTAKKKRDNSVLDQAPVGSLIEDCHYIFFRTYYCVLVLQDGLQSLPVLNIAIYYNLYTLQNIDHGGF